jgi:hypothetical protein
MTRESSAALQPTSFGLLQLPGFRTLRSRAFRTLVAAALASIGVVVLAVVLARQASDPHGQYAIDFSAYHLAAQRLDEHGSPYIPAMLEGPVDAQGVEVYRYPPPLAQVLQPAAGMPLGSVAPLWLIAQAVAIGMAMWLAVRMGLGRTPTMEATCWAAAAALYFLPVFDTLWKGNVSGLLALLVMLAVRGSPTAGIATSVAALLKLVPVVLIPVLAARGRGAMIACVVAGASITAVSVVLAPQAWLDFVVVLPNLFFGSADYPTNLAPAAVLAQVAALPGWVSGLARVITVLAALWCIAAAWRVSRHRGGVAAGVTLGVVAMLLLPAAIWYHYLTILLPLAVVAWFRADHRSRVLLLTGGVLVSLGVAALCLALVGGLLLVLGALRAFNAEARGSAIATTLLEPGLR